MTRSLLAITGPFPVPGAGRLSHWQCLGLPIRDSESLAGRGLLS